MMADEFVERWLTVGTESKIVATVDTDSLRTRQGEKGIGRLSVAYLGPIVLILSKRANNKFVACLIDWRLFENPFLLLEDIIIPVEEFASQDDLQTAFERMRTVLSENVWPLGQEARDARLRTGWNDYAATTTRAGGGNASVANEIASSILAFELPSTEQLSCWGVWSGKAVSGTALYVLDIRRELANWVDPLVFPDDDEVRTSKELLEETLTSFCDPYGGGAIGEFRYDVYVHIPSHTRRVISSDETIPLDEIRNLEHVLEGEVDENGTFTGRVRSFHREFFDVVIPSSRQLPKSKAAIGYVGPFRLLAATFEINAFSSSMSPEQHALWEERKDKYAGFAIYRDGLRVLPYGRQSGDLFEIDTRRSKNAGRYFWAYRRTFGRVALTRRANPNLIDKAGREGLMDNQARREFKLLVIDLLKTTAHRYFGTDVPERSEIIQENENRYRAEVRAAGRRSKKKTREELRKNEPQLEEALRELETVRKTVELIAKNQPEALPTYGEAIRAISRGKSGLAIGPPARGMDDEERLRYRAYRDRLNRYREGADELLQFWARELSKLATMDPMALASSRRDSLEAELTRSVGEWQRENMALLDREKVRSATEYRDDLGRFIGQSDLMLVELSNGLSTLAETLAKVESLKEDLTIEFEKKYSGYHRSLGLLSSGADLDAALSWSAAEIDVFRDRLSQVHALAQLGITVEIVGHEFEGLDGEIRRGLSRLPKDAQKTEAFRTVKRAHDALAQKIRFLTPLKLSGPRVKETITGREIAEYCRDFFEDRFVEQRIHFSVTPAFNAFTLSDYRHRIFPVFINLINNAVYWLTFVSLREIRIDVIDGCVVVADSGNGVDSDDVAQLFGLFFSRRAGGRGVGLYLSRENLEAGGFHIDYTIDPAKRILSGANFTLDFRREK